MNNILTAIAVRPALALGMGLTRSLSAHAGLVTGAWDPEFGPPLTTLSWAVKSELSVPDTCLALGNGDHLATVGTPCGGSVVNSAKLRLFETDVDAATDFDNFSNGGGFVEDFANLNTGLSVTAVRVFNGQVIGVATNTGAGALYPSVFASLDNLFGLGFTSTGPSVICFGCSEDGYDELLPNITAPLDELLQILTTFNFDGRPRLVDASGVAIGVRLNGFGEVLGLTGTPVTVPEPGSRALVLAALGSAAWLRRRRT